MLNCFSFFLQMLLKPHAMKKLCSTFPATTNIHAHIHIYRQTYIFTKHFFFWFRNMNSSTAPFFLCEFLWGECWSKSTHSAWQPNMYRIQKSAFHTHSMSALVHYSHKCTHIRKHPSHFTTLVSRLPSNACVLPSNSQFRVKCANITETKARHFKCCNVVKAKCKCLNCIKSGTVYSAVILAPHNHWKLACLGLSIQ